MSADQNPPTPNPRRTQTVVAAGYNPNFVRGKKRKPAEKKSKGAFSRIIRCVYGDTADGMGRLSYLHPGRGWRTRAATPTLTAQLFSR